MSASHINSISRRGAMSRMAVAAAAGIVVPAMAPVAHAASGTDGNLRTFKGRYALRGARALAHEHARAGKLAIVPDMPATYTGVAALAGRDAHVADIKGLSAAFGGHLRGSGKVEFVSA